MEVLVRTPELVVLLLQLSTLVLGDAISEFTRYDFPSDFVFGAGTSSYQYEGGAAEGGRTPSIWDTYAHEGHMKDGKTADVAADGYHKYKEDVKLMSETGLQGYRFSISWSRLLPSGRGKVNYIGVEYYNNVIDELIKYEFADVCFREFGDRVAYWTTLNEPNVVALYSYDYGFTPPKRCSYPFGVDCNGGNSTTEPYIAAHNMILAHSAAVEIYRTRYQAKQKGKIGLNIWTPWFYPLNDSFLDALAAKRALEYTVGWFMDPIMFGNYPNIMKKMAGTRLPSFTETESKQVKGAFDFIGINYYFPLFVTNDFDALKTDLRDMSADMYAKFADYKNKPPTSQISPPNPLPKDPRGLSKLLKYLKETYGNPPIYIQENGYGVEGEDELNDTKRVSYLSGFIGATLDSLRDGSYVRGYFVWSLVDLFELMSGYQLRIGLYHVNFDEDRKRLPKFSAHWYSHFLKNGSVVILDQESDGMEHQSHQHIQQEGNDKFENDLIYSSNI